MPGGREALKHIVVLMMENRSFDHLLGGLKALDPRINGVDATWSNPDTTGQEIRVAPKADYQGQLDPDPGHYFNEVDLQIFNGDDSPNRVTTMKGFIRSYYEERHNVKHSRQIMYYFRPDRLPVITTLAQHFAVFNAWFSSIPGPTLCNRAFAHYGTSFGHVGMELQYANQKYPSIYERMMANGRSAKLYYYDDKSSTLEVLNLLNNQGQFFGTVQQFLDDCRDGDLPDYSFIEPNYVDHPGPGGAQLVANDQHPDHHVLAGERLIAQVYNAIRRNPILWRSTAMLVTYDEHGGIFDHVVPPACTPDEFQAPAAKTGIGIPFAFDRLGVRVPAVLISPWVPKATVEDRVFEHASIPATVTEHFIGSFDERSPREKGASTFLNLLSEPAMRTDTPVFTL
jgi:phospholipase C